MRNDKTEQMVQIVRSKQASASGKRLKLIIEVSIQHSRPNNTIGPSMDGIIFTNKVQYVAKK